MEEEMDTCKDPFLFMHMQPSKLLEYKHLKHLKFKKKKKMVKKKKEELMEKKSFLGLTLLLLLLIASQETEARLCESQSHGFRGLCLSNHNCAVVCRNEHFVGGRCRGARRRCFCTRNC